MDFKITRRAFTLSTLGAAATSHGVNALAADAWPSKPIRMVLPNGAGSGTDLLGRLMIDYLSPALGQPIVIDNKPGASGQIATGAVAKATPDGYTLLYTNAGSTIMAEALIPNFPYSTLRDLVAVALNAVGGVILVVHPSVAANNLQELIALIKRNPDKYAYGTPGVGSNGHLTMEWIKQQTGMKTQHIPYKGTPPLMTELVSGMMPIGWVDISSPLPFIQQGRLRAIAINGERRNPQLPDLATMTEQGMSFPARGFQGIFAPVGTPNAIVQRVNTEMNRILAKPDYQAKLRLLNVDPPPLLDPAQFRELVASNLVVWKKITKEANIQMDN